MVINLDTCKACGVCAAICPNRIIHKDASGQMFFRPDRVALCFQCGQCMAACPTRSVQVTELSYKRDFFDLPEREDDSQAFFDLIASRRAIRNFQDKPVPRELLERIVQAISCAPPGFPPLKTELVVVQDSALIRQALPHMIELYDRLYKVMRNPLLRLLIRQEVGPKKFNVIQGHLVPMLESRLPDLKTGAEDTLTRRAPAMILFHADRQAQNYEIDAYIALTYGFLAAHALGLGGSAMDIIPPAIERSQVLRAMFGIPDDHEVVASMIVGYPKYRYQRAIKRELKSVTWF
ncbi:MAG: nitroreductase family protein [Thermoflexales bacterium]|nr:nitroreductase family protein [Thermoflexales bacterium]